MSVFSRPVNCGHSSLYRALCLAYQQYNVAFRHGGSHFAKHDVENYSHNLASYCVINRDAILVLTISADYMSVW